MSSTLATFDMSCTLGNQSKYLLRKDLSNKGTSRKYGKRPTFIIEKPSGAEV